MKMGAMGNMIQGKWGIVFLYLTDNERIVSWQKTLKKYSR